MFVASLVMALTASAALAHASEARLTYRDCISSALGSRPDSEPRDERMGFALEACRQAEAVLRAAMRENPGNDPAAVLAAVLDARLEGEEAGLKIGETR